MAIGRTNLLNKVEVFKKARRVTNVKYQDGHDRESWGALSKKIFLSYDLL